MAFEENSLSCWFTPCQFTPEFTAALRQLAGVKLRFVQAPRPVRSQGAVQGTGYWIFGHAVAGLEIARDEIRMVSGCGDGCDERMELFEAHEIGTHVLDCTLVVVYRDVGLIRFEDFAWSWPAAESADHGFGWSEAGFQEDGGEIHGKQFALSADRESPAVARFEPNGVKFRL